MNNNNEESNNIDDETTISDSVNTQRVSTSFDAEELNYLFSELDTRPALSHRRVLRLYIPQETEPIEFFSPDRIVMGRGGKGISLDLNLAERYGWMLGVSRQHAEIIYDGGRYYLADLNSTNGTFLNSTRLNPNERYPLESADQIRMGHFLILVNLA